MPTYLETQIALRRARLQELDRERITVEAELRAYEDVHIHQDTMLSRSKPPSKIGPSEDSIAGGSIQVRPVWVKILQNLATIGRSFTANDVVKAGEAVGSPTTLLNARGQIFQYSKKGIIRRVDQGKYVLTEKGSELIRKNEHNFQHGEPEAVGASGNY